MRQATPLSSLCLFALLCFVGSGCAPLEPWAPTNSPGSEPRVKAQGLQPTAVAAPPAPLDPVFEAYAAIARLEAGRQTGGGYLQTLVRHRDPMVRERATRALGRMPLDAYGRNVTAPLEVALRDDSHRVRRAAAFGLAQRGDSSCAESLVQASHDEDPDVRAQVWFAMGRLGTPELRAALLSGLEDPAPAAQAAAAQAIFYWPKETTPEEWAMVSKEFSKALATASSEVRARILFTWARRTELRSDWSAFLGTLERKDTDVDERLFAVLGLARAASDEVPPPGNTGLDPLRVALERFALDADERVVVEALRGLKGTEVDGRLMFRGNPAGLSEGLAQTLLKHPSAHVRAAAVLALGDDYHGPEPGQLLTRDSSSMVRRAAFEAYIRRHPQDAVARVREWGRSRDYRQRRTAAQTARLLDSEEARGILIGLTQDKHPQVAEEAIDQLQHFPDEETRVRLRNLCGDEDNGISLAAVSSLTTMELGPNDLPALIEAYQAAHGDGSSEVCFGALRAAAKIQSEDALEFLRAGLLHEDPYVVKVARAELDKRKATYESSPVNGLPVREYLELAPVWEGDLPNPRVAIETNRGTMVFELFPKVAPTHVHNFLTQASRGFYDGLTWHRVVSDFVIQGGCYRGDGNGGGTWRGYSDSLAEEFNELRYVEGALGMPRNENPDSGGSQIFVTHRPTPHLDFRYTLFGALVSGKEPLQTIEEGDRILSIRRLP